MVSRVQRFHDAAVNQVRERQHYLGLEKPLLTIVDGLDSDAAPPP